MATALSNMLAFMALDNTKFLKGLTDSQTAAAHFGNGLASIGGAVVLGAMTAAAGAVIGIGSAAFDAAETLDEAYDKIAVATGAMGPELDILKGDFDAVFAAIPTDAVTAADAIGVLNARLDITGEALQKLAIPLLEASRLLGGDAKTNAELFTRVMGDWNIPVENAAGSLDKIFTAAQQTGVPMDALMQSIVQYGAPMRNFGFSFEQAGALLAKFESEGVNTEIVMSGLRIAQGKFITSGVDMATGLWDTIDAIKTAKDKTEGLSLATEIFGAKAAGDMYDTIMAGKLDIDGLTESMLNADGAIMDAAAATSDWGEKWKIFQNKMTLALGPLGEKLREGFGKALDELLVVFNRPDVQAAIDGFANFAVVTISKIVEYIPTLISNISNFITFLQNNQGIVVGVFVALGVAALAWGVVTAAAAWTAMAPLLPVIGVLLLVAAAAYLLYLAWANNWGGIQQKTAAVAGWIKNAIKTLVDFVTAIWRNSTIQLVVQTILSNIRNLFGAFKSAFNGDWYAFGEQLRNIWDNNWNLLKTLFTTAWAGIIAKGRELLVNLKTVFTETDWGSVGTNIIHGIAQGIANGVSVIINAARNAAKAALNAAKGFLGIKSPSKLFEMQVGYQMAAGVALGWESGLAALLNPMLGNLAPANAQPAFASSPASSNGSGSASQRDSMVMEEIRRMLRDLPNEIARATATAAAKMPRSR